MKKLKLFLFALVAFFVVGFAVNVNALEVTEDLTLTEDVNEEIVIPAGKTVTLNLGGKTITAPSGKVAITNNGTLTIEGEGSVIANGNYAVSNHGTLLTINGGSYSKADVDATQALIANGWYNNEESHGAYAQMIINGGSFDGGSFLALKNDSYGKMTINDGTFITSDAKKSGIQEAGKELIINGGTFNTAIVSNTLASFTGEEKTFKISGGTFNNAVSVLPFDESSTSDPVTIASKLDVYITEAVFNGTLSVQNTKAPEGTLPVQVKELSNIIANQNVTIKGTTSVKHPSINIEGITVSSPRVLNLSNAEHSVIKNSTINRLQTSNVELINVKISERMDFLGTDTTTTLSNGTEISKILNTSNAGLNVIVDGATIGDFGCGFNSITVKNGTVDTMTLTKGNVLLEGGTVSLVKLNKSSNPLVITVSSPAIIGKIDASSRTDATTYSIVLPEGYQVDEETGNVTMPLSNAVVTLDKESYVYTGSEIKPEVTLVKYGSTELVKDTDYSVISYENNTNVGSAKVVIEGQGKYTGTIEKTFSINPIDLSSAKVTGIKTQTYNAKKQLQNSLVVKINDVELVKNVDYQVLYSKLINAGTIKMTIKGIGDYKGSLVETFVRKKAKNPLALKAYNKTVYYSKVKKSAQVVKPIYVSKKVGTLTYTKMSGSSTKLLLNKTTGKVTVKKGTKKGKYKIKIKVFASGSSNYFSNYGIKTIYVTVK